MAKKRGRRPKLIAPMDYLKIQRMGMEGLGHDAIARVLKLNPTTFRKRRAEDPYLDECYQQGQAAAERTLTRNLWYKAAVEKDRTSIIFSLKSRFGWRDNIGEQQPAHPPAADSVATLTALAALSVEELRQFGEILQRAAERQTAQTPTGQPKGNGADKSGSGGTQPNRLH